MAATTSAFFRFPAAEEARLPFFPGARGYDTIDNDTFILKRKR